MTRSEAPGSASSIVAPNESAAAGHADDPSAPVPLPLAPTPRQSWLIPYQNPLRRRLGDEFFRHLPRAPGVYRMLDDSGRVLYVGKARDLRARLGSYRFVAPGRGSRKVMRLISRARAVDFEICAGELPALLRENQLLREIQPSFNQQKTRPQLYVMAAVERRAAEAVTLRWWRAGRQPEATDSAPGEADGRFGVFKGVFALRRLAAALGRLSDLARGGQPARRWHRESEDNEAEIGFPVVAGIDWPRWLEAYLRGAHDRLVGGLGEAAARHGLDGFAAGVVSRDVEFLRQFYAGASRRGFLLRRRYGLRRGPIPPELLDDLMVRRSAVRSG